MDNKSKVAKDLLYCINLLKHQLKKGVSYSDLKPVYQIKIDNFNYFENDDLCSPIYFMNERKQKENEYINKFRVCLPNIKKICYTKDELEEFERICLIILSEDEKERRDLAGESEVLQRMVETIEEATKDAEFMELVYQDDYDEFQRGVDLCEARKSGKAEGKAEGIAEGKAEGIAYNIPYNIPIDVDTIGRRGPRKWTYLEGTKSLIVDTKLVF